MLHFSKPNLVIAEISSNEPEDYTILQKLTIPHVLKTSKYSVYSTTDAGDQLTRRPSLGVSGSVDSLPESDAIITTNDIVADILLVPNFHVAAVSCLSPKRMMAMTQVGGTICIVSCVHEREDPTILELAEHFTIKDKGMSLSFAFPARDQAPRSYALSRTARSTQPGMYQPSHKRGDEFLAVDQADLSGSLVSSERIRCPFLLFIINRA